mmetsp:Transcript_374/g.574  ORF Transcript_374/g.574 Transcript_374/m.574 type:complete len:269 (+) Transcript_374:219-1025(+)
MVRLVVLTLASLLNVFSVQGFVQKYGAGARFGTRSLSAHQRFATKYDGEESRAHTPTTTRADFLSSLISSVGSIGVISVGMPAFADEETDVSPPSTPPSAPTRTISECKAGSGGKPSNCISTRSIKKVDQYSPPWTFEVSADEAMARVKGVVETDPTLEMLEEDKEGKYLKVKASRNLVSDELEFIFDDRDQVVKFRSSETGEPSISDFGANRSRLEGIRKKAGVFGVMGEGLTADSYEGSRGSGPIGQLKAFYGLQSGKGFEEVFDR